MNPTAHVLLAMLILGATAVLAAAACAVARGRAAVPLLPRALLLVGVLAASGVVLAAVPAALRGQGPTVAAIDWQVPGGGGTVALDPLGAWFALVVTLVGSCVAWFAAGYLVARPPRLFAAFAFFYPLLLLLLLLVAVARHLLLFLGAWEAMTLCAFCLVVLAHEQESVRHAGRIYLVLNHLGAMCLLVAFVALGQAAGGFGFDQLAQARTRPGLDMGVIGLLLLLGFGTKAGIWPLHTWLPYAHPAAESPISAILSGVVLKAGIFGLLRFLPLLPPLPVWLCVTWIGCGAVSAVLGVLLAVAQKELKRLLAYSSVENTGICLLAVGVAALGTSLHNAEVAALGVCAALLHLCNHALCKTTLFLGAGLVLHGAGSGRLDQLGGLTRAMPRTAALFLAASFAICGLPPANAFVSEWTLYRALFLAVQDGAAVARIAACGALLMLALTGGLAVLCFVRLGGALFLGTPRAALRHPPHEPARFLRGAVLPLLAAGLLIGLCPTLAFAAVWAPATAVLQPLVGTATVTPDATLHMLRGAAIAGALFLCLVAALLLLRRRLLPRATAAVPTWGCGYALPGSAMQYTASSFGWSVLGALATLVLPRARRYGNPGPFPPPPAVESEVRDLPESYVLRPAWALLLILCRPFRVLQWPPVQVQMLLMLLTLAVLLLWKVTL